MAYPLWKRGVKSIFVSSRRACFLLGWSSNIILRLICPKSHWDEIFSNFWTKSWVNQFETIPVCPLCKIDIFFVQEGLLSNWMINKHYFKAHFVQKQAKRKLTFLTKIMWNLYFYSPGRLVFLTSWSIYLITCWLHDILIYLLNYCSTGISTYWLNI